MHCRKKEKNNNPQPEHQCIPPLASIPFAAVLLPDPNQNDVKKPHTPCVKPNHDNMSMRNRVKEKRKPNPKESKEANVCPHIVHLNPPKRSHQVARPSHKLHCESVNRGDDAEFERNRLDNIAVACGRRDMPSASFVACPNDISNSIGYCCTP